MKAFTGPEAFDKLRAQMGQPVSFMEAWAFVEWWLAKPFENAGVVNMQAFKHLRTDSVFVRFPDATVFADEVYNKLIASYRQAGWGDVTLIYGDTPETEYQVMLVLSKPLPN
jgi:hypothetical protein